MFDSRKCWEVTHFLGTETICLILKVNKVSGNKIQTMRHCDYNWLHWEGHCDQQSDRFLKLTLLLQVILVTRRSSPVPRSGELRTQKLKSHLVRTQSLNVLPLKPGIGQYIAKHATLTARDFFLAYFYPSGPFTCIFSKPSPDFFLCWLWLTPVPV